MKTVVSCAVLLLVGLSVLPSMASAEVHTGRYIAGTGQAVLWCAAEAHAIVPVGGPEDYETLEGWLFSGEPECAAADALNTVDETIGGSRQPYGFGGLVFDAGEDGAAMADVRDDVFGSGQSYLRLVVGLTESEGCGPQLVIGNPDSVAVVFIHAVGVTDGLNACFATTGTVTVITA